MVGKRDQINNKSKTDSEDMVLKNALFTYDDVHIATYKFCNRILQTWGNTIAKALP